MAALAPSSSQVFRGLLIGNNGTGKTGALASLAKAGYNLRIADADNGAEILTQLLTPEELARVDVETHRDSYGEQGGAMKVLAPLTGFKGIAGVLTNWPGYGKPTSWERDTVLVLDSMTFTGRSILNHVLALNGRLNMAPQIQDWGMAMELQENMIAMMTGGSIKCHVIVTAHVTYVQPEGELVTQGYPSALGNKLPPKIGGYFNTMLNVRKSGTGSTAERRIFTKPVGQIECKTPAPGKVKDDYPLSTGLAQLFRDLYGPGPAEK